MTGKTEVVWEDPPQRRSPPYDWSAIAEQLEANPGEWAKIFEEDRTSLATAIRIGGIKVLDPSNGFEVRTRNNTRGEPRTCTLYLRYSPEKDQRKES